MGNGSAYVQPQMLYQNSIPQQQAYYYPQGYPQPMYYPPMYQQIPGNGCYNNHNDGNIENLVKIMKMFDNNANNINRRKHHKQQRD